MKSRVLKALDKRVAGKKYSEVFTKVPKGFYIYGAHLTGKAKSVYFALLAVDFDFSGVLGQFVQVSPATLAEMTGLSAKSVRRAIQELEYFGWVEVEHGGRGTGLMNKYCTNIEVIFPKDENGNVHVCPTKEQAKEWQNSNQTVVVKKHRLALVG